MVSLSSDDPPLLSALATGHVTITAGGASADVTVFSATGGGLPLGSVLWSNPGGSGVTAIVPAVPSPTGVADVFALQSDGTVQAITSDGATAWSVAAFLPGQQGLPYFLPDFQGGLVVINATAGSIMKVDGITGQVNSTYTMQSGDYFGGQAVLDSPVPYSGVAVHTDGTIFALINQVIDPKTNKVAVRLAGIDPTSGAEKFSVPFPSMYISEVVGPIIAGDGYAYMLYWATDSLAVSQMLFL